MKWSIVAPGQGGNRISFLYYAKFKNPLIEDRVLLLNTTTSDVAPFRALDYLFSKNAKYKEIFEKMKHRICIFGKSPSGAGNNWKIGELEAKYDFELIDKYFSSLGVEKGDVVLGITTLGGGTGSGSLPYIIHKLKSRVDNFFALGILPFDFEGAQRYFNTICGISRLLRYNNEQNADMLILIENSRVEKYLEVIEKSEEERYYRINQEIIKVINMLISPGGEGAKATIDVADYYQLPRSIGVYHFAPCISFGNDPEVFSLEALLEAALENPLAPFDTKTATMAYIVVVAPKEYIDKGIYTQIGLERISKEWADKNLVGGGILRYSSLVASEQDSVDVMILLGGFSFKQILSKYLRDYYNFKESLSELVISREEIDKLEEELKKYVAKTEESIERIREIKEGKEFEEKLKSWLE